MTYKTTTHSFDADTIKWLGEIAKLEADNERPNESKTLRKLIRDKAAELGIVVQPPPGTHTLVNPPKK